MTTEHPITPPPELVEQWANSSPLQHLDEWWVYELHIAHHAARWGADQELDACCEWCADGSMVLSQELRDARRPKPPILAEEALTSLSHLKTDLRQFGLGSGSNDIHTIRAALERLKELEGAND